MTKDIGVDARTESVRLEEQVSAPVSPGAGFTHVFAKADGLYIVNDSDEEIGPFITGSAGGGYTEGAKVYNDANQGIPDATLTTLNFNQERYDTDGIHSTATGTFSRLTCQTAGTYIILVSIAWDSNAVGYRQVGFRLNGSTRIGDQSTPSAAPIAPVQTASTIYKLAVTDYAEIVVYQTSGDALDILSFGNKSPEFAMQRVGNQELFE